MRDEEINVAIAEACGWTFGPGESEASMKAEAVMCWVRPGNSNWQREHIPNYCTDLNVMHEAEKLFDGMDYQFKNKYAGTLEEILEAEIKKGDPECIPDVWGFEMINATARQRAEAFLRCIGKWKE